MAIIPDGQAGWIEGQGMPSWDEVRRKGSNPPTPKEPKPIPPLNPPPPTRESK